MRVGLIIYFFRKALENVRFNPLLSLITLTTIAISLLILGMFGLIYLNMQQLLDRWGDNLRVTVYLNDTLAVAQAERLQAQIAAWPEVKSVAYVSKEEALARFRRQLREYAGLLEGLQENPLPASLEIRLEMDAVHGGAVDDVLGRLQQIPGATEVHSAQQWRSRLQIAIDAVKMIGLAVGGLLLIATIFVISNTVKLTYYARQEELEIMKLVGATDAFIKAPFLIEGVLHGLGGAALAVVLLVAFLKLLFSHLAAELHLSGWLSPTVPWSLVLTFVAAGVALGLLGSATSLRRFLRV